MNVFIHVADAIGSAQLRGVTANVAVPNPVNPFPTAPYPNALTQDSKFQSALDAAVADAETRRGQPAGSFNIPITIAESTDGFVPFSMCGFRDTEVDYIASEAKVSVMYAAYELRAMVRRFAAANPLIPPAQLFAQMAAVQNPQFVKSVDLLNSATNITDVHRLGECATTASKYANVFAPPSSAGALIDFTPTYKKHLRGMIVPSNNGDAMACIHGLGYSYLNGALAKGGFFDGSAGNWVASDYQFEKVWPAVRAVKSENDDMATLTGTTRNMASMMALIVTGDLVDNGTGNGPGAAGSSQEMRDLLHHAVQDKDMDPPWLCDRQPARDGVIPIANYQHNKLGLGPKGKGPLQFCSEVSEVSNVVASGRSYVVAFQAWLENSVFTLNDVSRIVVAAITAYE